MSETLKRIRGLQCSCCGGLAIGRQYWNQDEGYGICDECVVWIEKREKDERYIESCYGKKGVYCCLNEKS